jgi:hypothetical protein
MTVRELREELLSVSRTEIARAVQGQKDSPIVAENLHQKSKFAKGQV